MQGSVGQTNISTAVRRTIITHAYNNGGLRDLCRKTGQPYNQTWERVNRNKGDLLDLVVALANANISEPLREVVDATPYELQPKMRFLRAATPAKPLTHHALDLHHACSFVTALIVSALESGVMGERERRNVKSAIHAMRVKMAELEYRLEPNKEG